MTKRLATSVEQAPVTLVSAGAGSGKTTAVRSWYATRTGGKAWVTVDAGANEPGALWREVLRALAGTDVPPAEAYPALVASAALARPVVLVLDDLHEITNGKVLAELCSLIDRCPPGLRLVLVSRSDPPWRLQRWRVAGTLADVRAADLALSRSDAADLAARHGLALTPEQLDELMARSQGWAAGFQLAVEAMRGREAADADAAIAGFTGARRDVAEYVVSEVLRAVPADAHAFLARTSVVEELSGPLAETLMEDPGAPALLERLAAEHELLVVADADGRTYRYHRLLREAFYHELTSRQPVLGRVQHGRAASWYADRGRWVDAVRHAMLSRDADRITRVCLTALPRLYSGDADRLVAALRPAGAAPTPGLTGALTAAAEHLHQGDLDAVRGDLARCRQYAPPADLRDAVAAVLRVLDLEVAARRPDPAATVAIAEDARQLLDIAGPVIGPVVAAYRAVVECRLGIGLMWLMRPLQAEASLRAALRPALARDLIRVQALGHAHLAWLHAGAGRCRAAERHATAALRRPEVTATPARLALAQVFLLRADLAGAGRQLSQWAGLVIEHGADPLDDLAAMIMEARLHLARGTHVRAGAILAEAREKVARDGASAPLLRHWLAEATADAELAACAYSSITGIAGGDHGAERVRVARAELGLGRTAPAAEIVRAVLAESPDVLTEVRARVVDAVAEHKARRDTAALAAVGEALAAAEPEGLLLPFAELDHCLDIVRLHRDLGGACREFADTVLAMNESPPVPSGLAERLTDRELVVLRQLPTLRGNTEIGASMFVTVNTVKAHLKAVYRKLGVTNRRQAVERARELHLL